jgi:hypothetical protein
MVSQLVRGGIRTAYREERPSGEGFPLGHWARYDYDLTAGKLLFSQEGKVAVVAEIQIAGSTSAMAGNWL